MATYSIFWEDGTPAGQQSCTKGDRCYPPLQPGQYKVALGEDTTQAVPSGMAAPLRVTSIDADGKLVHPDRAAMPAGIQNPATVVNTSLDVPNVSMPAKEDRTAAAPPIAAQQASQGYAAPTSGTSQYSDPYAAFANVPNYRTGQRHPAAGGLPLTAGGPFAAQDDGYDNRQQMYVPGGAAAGPFETRSAPTPSGANTGGYGGGQAWNDQGRQGGGGGTHPLYDKLRAKGEQMAGKVRDMANSAGGGGAASGGYSGSSDTSSTRQYRRQGRRMERASDRYYDEVNNPDPQKARGWAKQNIGNNKGNYGIYLTDPMRLIGDADLPVGGANTLEFLRDEPAAELAMIMGGTGRRDMTRKVKPVRVPKALKGSIDPLKPEFKRELDYSKYTKQLADIYADLQGGGQSANFDTLMGKLATAKRSGALMQGIDMQAASGDVGGALDRAKGYFDAVFATSQPEPLQGVYSRMAERRLSELNLGRKKPKAISKAVKRIAQEFV